MRLHLIDGTYELFRSFFGAPSRLAPDGTEVGAVQGIVASTLSLLGSEDVSHVGVAFDTVITSFRNDLYPGYKTGEGVPEELLTQFPLAEEALESVGVVVWRMREYEADDALASAVEKYGDDFEQVVLMSPDKDLAQCVHSDAVVTFDRKRGFIDEAGVIEKFGVRPASIPDYLGLVGDSADGFPGVRGWGAKSASVVLAEYEHIERIPLEHELWGIEVRGAARLVETLRSSIADALLFRFLAMLRRDVPLTETVDDLRWDGAPRDQYLETMDRFGFDTLRERPSRWT